MVHLPSRRFIKGIWRIDGRQTLRFPYPGVEREIRGRLRVSRIALGQGRLPPREGTHGTGIDRLIGSICNVRRFATRFHFQLRQIGRRAANIVGYIVGGIRR